MMRIESKNHSELTCRFGIIFINFNPKCQYINGGFYQEKQGNFLTHAQTNLNGIMPL